MNKNHTVNAYVSHNHPYIVAVRASTMLCRDGCAGTVKRISWLLVAVSNATSITLGGCRFAEESYKQSKIIRKSNVMLEEL